MSKSSQLVNLINSMELDDIQDVMENAGDDVIWRPFFNDYSVLEKFNELMSKIEESQKWNKTRNKEKGTLLEELMQLVSSRFIMAYTYSQEITTDNEIDLNIKFNEVVSTHFIKKNLSHFICECKNVATSSINVGTVAKLVELCQCNGAGLGIFISHKGVSGIGWKHGEGKRRKLFLSKGLPIISFKLAELQALSSKDTNFYTMIKEKYQMLIDEVDYDGPSLKGIKKDNPDFRMFLIDTLASMRSIQILNEEEAEIIQARIAERYGAI